MKNTALFTLPLILMLFSCAKRDLVGHDTRLSDIESWVCCYSANARTADLAQFDLAVLDADSHPNLNAFKGPDRPTLIGYVSIGEVAEYRWFWPDIAGKSWILEKNPNWDSYLIDVRAPEWQKVLISKIIPAVLAQGFDGIFLDTVDTAEYLERYRPEGKMPGAEQAMIRLIKSIRKQFPEIYIIMNRGFAIVERVNASTDGVLAESLFSTIDWETGSVRLRNAAEYDETVRRLSRLNKYGTTIFTLDYLASAEESTRKTIEKKSRKLGFIPYFSTPELDTVYFYTLNDG